jgi:uncharacterized membrane protein YcgQ (UPF0703/DUF1980 family)
LPGDFKLLEGVASDPAAREKWKGKTVTIKGQFAPARSSRAFELIRLRIQCCGADAVKYSIPVFCKENIPELKMSQWIQITGTVEFRQRQPNSDSFITILIVPKRNLIQPTEPDLNPYLQ